MVRGGDELERARAAKAEALRVFGRVATVCGVGITRVAGHYAVKVNLECAPDPDSQLPEEIGGVPVVVHVVGRIRRQRPGAAR